MANKQQMKKSEARILVYLKTADPRLRYSAKIAAKLGTDYGYLLKTLNEMVTKTWIKKIKSDYGKTFYQLTGKANMRIAVEIVADLSKHKGQVDLHSFDEGEN